MRAAASNAWLPRYAAKACPLPPHCLVKTLCLRNRVVLLRLEFSSLTDFARGRAEKHEIQENHFLYYCSGSFIKSKSGGRDRRLQVFRTVDLIQVLLAHAEHNAPCIS